MATEEPPIQYTATHGVRVRFTEVRGREKPRIKGRWNKLRKSGKKQVKLRLSIPN